MNGSGGYADDGAVQGEVRLRRPSARILREVPSGRRLTAVLVFFLLGIGAASGQADGSVTIAPGSYKVGFSPGDSALQVVEQAIGMAHESVLVACYEFTSREIARELLQASARGVKVAVVADKRASEERYSEVPYLVSSGLAVRPDGRHRIMHDKFMVIDGRDVETGSFNYTEAAVKDNAENALLLLNVPGLAASYVADWQALWNESLDAR